jgi:membrane-bound lytic murein transglycosylase D
MRNFIYLILFTLIAPTFSYATIDDTSDVKITKYSRFIANLDSMTNLYYVKQSLKMQNVEFIDTADYDEDIPSDSVFEIRLATIPSMIDLPYNDKVQAFINLYVYKRRKMVETMIGLSDHYFPIFEEVLDYHGMPLEFKYLPIIESALNPRAISRAGATGIWQFMYTTGKLYNLEVNSFVDERMDPVKASHSAARFLKDLYGLYGDWTLALAAYNCGPGNVNKAIRRSGGKTDFWEIYNYLPRETRGYVPSFIAATYLMHFYTDHNIVPIKIELPIVTDTVMVKEELHLKQVCALLDLPIEQIRDLNPQYKVDIIPAKAKQYPLRLPASYATKFIELEDSIYNYNDSVYFNKNKKVVVAPKSNSYSHAYPPSNTTAIYYTVKSGDNLGFIASWYNVSVNNLRYWNNIRGNMIRVGQKLVVYVPTSKVSYYEEVNGLSFDQKQARIGKKPTNNKPSTTTKKKEDTYTGEYIIYTVKSGDSPWSIAQKYPGVSQDDIMRINNISNSKGLRPGQKLKIPKK